MPGLVAAELPFLAGIDPSTVLAIRENEEAFSEWRTELRNAIRIVESLPGDSVTFEAEARDVLTDTLVPRANAVRKAVSISAAMKDATKDGVTDFGVSAAAIGLAGLAVGGPPGAGIGVLVAGIAVPLRWIYKIAFRPTPSGASGVLAQLVRRK